MDVVSTVFAIVIAPFVFAWTDVGISVGRETNGFLGLFKGLKWDTKQDFDFFRKSFDVVVHTSQHNNERNDTD